MDNLIYKVCPGCMSPDITNWFDEQDSYEEAGFSEDEL